MKSLNKTIAITCMLGLQWSLPFSLSTWAQSSVTNPIQFSPPPLENQDRPGGRRNGTASRDECSIPEGQPALTALIPVTKIAIADDEQNAPNLGLTHDESVFSLTTNSLPSFWFYVPYSQDDNVLFDFIFQDASGNTLYQQQFASESNGPGIIQVSLPETVSPLILDQAYQWYLLAHCTSDLASVSPYVSGWISRTQLPSEIQRQLNTASSLKQAEIYADHGIWQDSLTHLGELYREAPEQPELRAHWRGLLSSVGLDNVSDQPLVD